MTNVSPEDKDAMKRLLEMMEGKTPSSPSPTPVSYGSNEVELAGAGQVTQRDIDAMSSVIKKLNSVTQEVISESYANPILAEAVQTKRNEEGVKVGSYQIMIKEDQRRLAGKQYYSIYHSRTNDIIANDLSLYETALMVVKLLNAGGYVNDPVIRKLFEADDFYTSHRTDAIRFKAKARSCEKIGDRSKMDVFESRYQASLDNAMTYKKQIKKLISEYR